MEPSEHLAHLRKETDAFLGAAAVDPGAAVASCPGWAVRDLVLHVGNTWARAADVLATGRDAERRPLPAVESDAQVLSWGRDRADEIVDAVERLSVPDPEGECWTFLPPHNRGFWARRITLETLLHGWDCRAAVGPPSPMDADLAADGVDEFVFVMLPRCLQRNPAQWSGETVHLHRTDGEGEWFVRLDDGEVSAERGHRKGDVAVRGTGSDLYLWCTGRGTLATLPELDVVGDRAVADEWSAVIRF